MLLSIVLLIISLSPYLLRAVRAVVTDAFDSLEPVGHYQNETFGKGHLYKIPVHLLVA